LRTSRTALLALAVVLGSALIGAVAAAGWHVWWAPAPEALVYGKAPYFMPDGEFRSTGTYVAIAWPTGLVLGVIVMVWRRRDPLVALIALVVGAAIAGAVMLAVGMQMGPGDPVAAARHAAEMTSVPGMLRVQPGAAWCAFPFGAVLGALAVLLTTSPVPVERPRD
jgi:hypothetical protein